MVKLSKRMKASANGVDKNKAYNIEEAVSAIQTLPKVKFDESVDLHFHLNIDPKNTEQAVRGTVALPHGTGRTTRVVVFCKGELVEKAKNAGAEHVGAEDLINKISQGFLDFDCIIATPDLMREISKLGKILGPRGLMPSPKSGTVTMDVERAIKEIKAGKIEFKIDKQCGIHVGIGKKSFSKEQLVENALSIINSVNNAKPVSVKGNLIKSLYMSTTMGPGFKLAA